ncbi:MAG: hypothetical protein ACK5SX_07865, partial [Sandaracinobacter sp.]
LRWRKPAAARDYPALNLTIRPAFHFKFNLEMLLHEVQHFAGVGRQAPANLAAGPPARGASGLRSVELRLRATANLGAGPPPRNTYGLRSVDLQWRTPTELLAASMPASVRQTPAAFVAQAQRIFAAPAPDAHQFAKAYNRRSAISLMAWREMSVVTREDLTITDASRSTLLLWDRRRDLHRPATTEPGAVDVAAGRSKGSLRQVSGRRTTAQHTPAASFSPLRRALSAPTTPEPRSAYRPTILARYTAVPSHRSSPPTEARSRRTALDLAWQTRADAPTAAQDLAALARALSAPEFSRGVSVTHAASPGPILAAPAVVFETGRIVDEVIDRIERRVRSDRLRRGL